MKLNEIRRLIKESGIKKSKIAEALGISETSLRNKLAGKTPFTWDEVISLANLLHLKEETCLDVFFEMKFSNLETFEKPCVNAI